MNKFKSKFEITASVKTRNLSEEDRKVAVANLKNIKDLAKIDDAKSAKLKPIAFDLAVINMANRKGDGIDSEHARRVAERIKYHPINIEHDKYNICGVITNAGFYSRPDHESLSSDSLSNDPLYLSVGGLLYKRVAGGLVDFIEYENEMDDLTVSASWEIEFSDYNIMRGSNIFAKCEEITGNDKEKYEKFLIANGGDGFDDEGVPVFRKPIGDIEPVGVGITLNPAAEVKGIVDGSSDEDEDDMSEIASDLDEAYPSEDCADCCNCEDSEEDCEMIAAEDKKNKKLNKPFRLPSGSAKKFGVYVKNDKGNIVVVKFGDPNMEIRRDNPEARKNFRARHGCDNPGPKWKAKYWSCKMWSAKPVSDIASVDQKKSEEKISQTSESNVIADRDIPMDINLFKTKTLEAFASNTAPSGEDIISLASRAGYEMIVNKVQEAAVQYTKQLAEKESEKTALASELETVKSAIASVEKQLSEANAELLRQKSEKEAAEKTGRIDSAMASIDAKFEVSPEERAFVVAEITNSDVSETTIASVLKKYDVIFASKAKKPAAQETPETILSQASANGSVVNSSSQTRDVLETIRGLKISASTK